MNFEFTGFSALASPIAGPVVWIRQDIHALRDDTRDLRRETKVEFGKLHTVIQDLCGEFADLRVHQGKCLECIEGMPQRPPTLATVPRESPVRRSAQRLSHLFRSEIDGDLRPFRPRVI